MKSYKDKYCVDEKYEKQKYEQRRSNGKVKCKKPRNMLEMHLIFIVVFFVVACFFFMPLPNQLSNIIAEKKANYKQVDATISAYTLTWQSDRLYTVYYKYVDIDGEEYVGRWKIDIDSEEEAKAMVGQTVKIYFDSDLKLHKSDVDDNKNDGSIWISIVGGGIFLILILISLIRIIIYAVQWSRYKKSRQSDDFQ